MCLMTSKWEKVKFKNKMCIDSLDLGDDILRDRIGSTLVQAKACCLMAPYHYPRDCLLKRLFWCKSKETSNSASLAFVRGIHRWPVNSPHKGPVTRKMFPFDDVIIRSLFGLTVIKFHWERQTEIQENADELASFYIHHYHMISWGLLSSER